MAPTIEGRRGKGDERKIHMWTTRVPVDRPALSALICYRVNLVTSWHEIGIYVRGARSYSQYQVDDTKRRAAALGAPRVPLCRVVQTQCHGNVRETRIVQSYRMLVRRLLVRLPDLPGSLGKVTTLLGRLGVDIREVRILGRDGRYATDEFIVAIQGPVLDACLVDLLEELESVHVLVFQEAPDGLVQNLVALAERKTDQAPPLLDVVVEDLGGNGHDTAPFGQ